MIDGSKKNDPRREARIAKNNRNLNSALTLFTAGFIAEFYLLLINQYFVKGSVDQVVAIAGYLEVMAIVGAAAFGAGVVLTVMRRKWTRFAAAGKWLLGLGLFFASRPCSCAGSIPSARRSCAFSCPC